MNGWSISSKKHLRNIEISVDIVYTYQNEEGKIIHKENKDKELKNMTDHEDYAVTTLL